MLYRKNAGLDLYWNANLTNANFKEVRKCATMRTFHRIKYHNWTAKETGHLVCDLSTFLFHSFRHWWYYKPTTFILKALLIVTLLVIIDSVLLRQTLTSLMQVYLKKWTLSVMNLRIKKNYATSLIAWWSRYFKQLIVDVHK